MTRQRRSRGHSIAPLTPTSPTAPTSEAHPTLSSSTSEGSESSMDSLSLVPLRDSMASINLDDEACPTRPGAEGVHAAEDVGYTGGMKISLPMTPPPSAGPVQVQFSLSPSSTQVEEESETESADQVPTEPPPHYSAPATRLPQPHREYYFSDGDVTFQVQDRLFRLHSFLMKRESSGIILRPERPLSGTHPNAHETPIVLRVPLNHFEPFVRILYHPIYRSLEASLLEWVSVLALSTRWDFTDLRTMAIEKIYDSPLCAVEKIQLAQTFHIPEWLHECYVDLCQRVDPLSFDEAEAVGVRVAIILHQARERVARETTWFHTPDVETVVREVMKQ